MNASFLLWMALATPMQLAPETARVVDESTQKIIQHWAEHRPSGLEQEPLYVANVDELYSAVKTANRRGFSEIILADGIYQLPTSLTISGTLVTLRSASSDRDRVVLRGPGMQKQPGVHNLIRVTGAGFRLSGITAEKAPNHIIQIAGEANADAVTLDNCRLQDSGEQLLKVSVTKNSEISSDYGHIDNCLFAFTAGIGPQFYIGGIDAHGSRYWIVENSQFWSIASPDNRVAQFAIHFWNQSAHNLVRNNLIVNSDRGIGFGLGKNINIGGVIRDNTIVSYDATHPNNDTGIVLEASTFSIVFNNTVVLKGDYPRAVELRRESTRFGIVTNNRVNRAISTLQGAEGTIEHNLWSEEHPPIATLVAPLPEEFR